MAERKAFLLRLDREIYDAIQRWADAELRSVNAQIEFLLREALRSAGRLPGRKAGSEASGGNTHERS
ncbi:MAG: Arc family DNA-binding protein [Bryobacterales bacterium]|nr:Arc family DNA-binding protein [Bryobacteraceae bacterium]MDW8130177.1 Arc family DNA-binding protein [Bryobacterales bacterium]